MIAPNETAVNAIRIADRISAGWGGQITSGFTDRYRTEVYGDIATRNQNGTEYAIGRVAAFGVEMYLTRRAMAGNRQASSTLRVLGRTSDIANTGLDYYQVGKKIYNGTVQPADLAPLTLGPIARRLSSYSPNLGASSILGVHGNSNQSPKPTHVYVIFDRLTGRLMKPGINGQPLNQNGTSPRANQQVNEWNRTQPGRCEAVNVQQNLPRPQARQSEQRITDSHAARNGGNMPSPIHQRPIPRVDSREGFINLYGVPDNR